MGTSLVHEGAECFIMQSGEIGDKYQSCPASARAHSSRLVLVIVVGVDAVFRPIDWPIRVSYCSN